jgi:iron complex outermembrane receptor protein
MIRCPSLLAAGGLALGCPLAEAQAAKPEQTFGAGEVSAETPTDHILKDIIVTARRRPEPLQRTPVSIVALSKNDLDARSVTNLRTLQNFVPNLTFAPSQNVGEASANVFIRGIGQEDFGIGAEAGVAFYVDGVYFPHALGLLMNLDDVARVEVLRGPQGTLYGKDAIGGAINLISTMPGPDRELTASTIIGNTDRVEARAVINEPIVDRLFVRLALGLVNRDGHLRRLPPPAPLGFVERVSGKPLDLRREGDERSQGARLQMRWLVSDTLSVDVSADGSRKRDTQGANHIDLIDPRFGIFPEINALIRQGKLPGPQITNALAPHNLLESYAGDRNFTNQDLWGVSIVLTKELGRHSLKFIGAFRGLRSHVGTDSDGLYFEIAGSDLLAKQRQFSAEAQLSRTVGELTYAAGLYAFAERSELPPSAPVVDILYTCGCFYTPGSAPAFTADPRKLRSASYAAYVQGTYKLTNKLSATLGGRYTHEAKRLDGKSYLLDARLQRTDTLVATGHAQDSWNAFTYRAGLEYQASSRVMAYGSIARGFKSGGFNVRGDVELPNMGFTAFDPETALTYEVGVRAEWPRRGLRLNATLFDTEYKNIQLRQQTVIAGEVTTLIENAASARIRGAEVELMAVPMNGLTFTAAYGRLHPRYLDVGRVRGLTLDSRFQRTPSDSFNASVNYELPVSFGSVELHGDYSYRSKEQFQITPALNDQKGYGLIGARITLRPLNRHWSIALFGTNLADVRYRVAGRGTLISQVGFAFSTVGMPRQVGLQMSSEF